MKHFISTTYTTKNRVADHASYTYMDCHHTACRASIYFKIFSPTIIFVYMIQEDMARTKIKRLPMV